VPGQDLESKVADPAAQRGFRNVTQADLSQAAGNKALIDRGERVLLRPGNVSTGGVDSITVSFDKARERQDLPQRLHHGDHAERGQAGARELAQGAQRGDRAGAPRPRRRET
jgi:hypothetical protein